MFPRAWKEVGEVFENMNRKCSRDKDYNLLKSQLSRLPLFMQKNGIFRSIHVAPFGNFESFESYSIIEVSGNGEGVLFSIHPLVQKLTRTPTANSFLSQPRRRFTGAAFWKA